ncbi:hypothetical protein FDP41_012716 [Naegleria fowleri]|uniref:Uncharacterized protein n=1 Tax=Naegleria fowleri TaxID=5763 RepID=A0A6A5C501_NAEFO|nr:uncharacterized protein FDP41_012716 [Naegleria fowleri]KAF0980928.1 hypothetical protein FDP41_012716 [Naegleria fowleri]
MIPSKSSANLDSNHDFPPSLTSLIQSLLLKRKRTSQNLTFEEDEKKDEKPHEGCSMKALIASLATTNQKKKKKLIDHHREDDEPPSFRTPPKRKTIQQQQQQQTTPSQNRSTLNIGKKKTNIESSQNLASPANASILDNDVSILEKGTPSHNSHESRRSESRRNETEVQEVYDEAYFKKAREKNQRMRKALEAKKRREENEKIEQEVQKIKALGEARSKQSTESRVLVGLKELQQNNSQANLEKLYESINRKVYFNFVSSLEHQMNLRKSIENLIDFVFSILDSISNERLSKKQMILIS